MNAVPGRKFLRRIGRLGMGIAAAFGATSLLTLPSCVAAQTAPASARPPNIVLIFADDGTHRYSGDVRNDGFHGRPAADHASTSPGRPGDRGDRADQRVRRAG